MLFDFSDADEAVYDKCGVKNGAARCKRIQGSDGFKCCRDGIGVLKVEVVESWVFHNITSFEVRISQSNEFDKELCVVAEGTVCFVALPATVEGVVVLSDGGMPEIYINSKFKEEKRIMSDNLMCVSYRTRSDGHMAAEIPVDDVSAFIAGVDNALRMMSHKTGIPVWRLLMALNGTAMLVGDEVVPLPEKGAQKA